MGCGLDIEQILLNQSERRSTNLAEDPTHISQQQFMELQERIIREMEINAPSYGVIMEDLRFAFSYYGGTN